MAAPWRLFDAQSSRHNTETSITLRTSNASGFSADFQTLE